MDPSWDTRHGAPINTYAMTSQLRVGPVDSIERHTVHPDPTRGERLPLEALLLRRPSDTMIVVLHGALERDKYELPRFEWFRTLSHNRSETLLFLADTTLSLDDKLTLAWYGGTRTDDLRSRYVALIEHVRSEVGARHVIVMGASGGGFAALAIARRLADSLAIAFCPQTRASRYIPWTFALLHRTVYPEFDDFAAVEAAFPTRFDLHEQFRRELPAPNARFHFVQSVGDSFHYRDHALPFAEQLGAPVTGGVTADGLGTFIFEDWGPGHRGPDRDRLVRALDEGIETLRPTPSASFKGHR